MLASAIFSVLALGSAIVGVGGDIIPWAAGVGGDIIPWAAGVGGDIIPW